MAILWCGGEDIDFPNGTLITTGATAGWFRAGYGRCAIQGAGVGVAKSTLFPGGAITAGWITFEYMFVGGATPTWPAYIGFGASGTTSGLMMGFNQTSSGTLSISKLVSGVATVLATSTSLITINTLHRIDMQLISYGGAGTINLYVDGTLQLTYTGSLTIAGVAGFDSVFINQNGGQNACPLSEIIVADEDTRSFSLFTMAPISAGTTDQWTGLFSAVNPTLINDANSNFTNTVNQDQQYHLTALPTGSFAVRRVKVASRAAATAGSTATKVSNGFNIGGTVSVGAAHGPLGTAFGTQEDNFDTNPVSAVAWTTGDLSTLQVDVKST